MRELLGATTHPRAVTILIESTRARDVPDADMHGSSRRLRGGGFTAPERASEILAPAAVRARGDIPCAGPGDSAGVYGLIPLPVASREIVGLRATRGGHDDR